MFECSNYLGCNATRDRSHIQNNFINHSSKLTHYNQIYYKIRIIGIE
ncbi:MAG: hypothetical protein Q8830_03930 [Candidatus Phytoplasma australasiaticum]|nr:hypothetical protein [Candidatus Phytoplasma australasiaticum]